MPRVRRITDEIAATALRLREDESMFWRDIAARLGWPMGSLHDAVRRYKRKLRPPPITIPGVLSDYGLGARGIETVSLREGRKRPKAEPKEPAVARPNLSASTFIKPIPLARLMAGR